MMSEEVRWIIETVFFVGLTILGSVVKFAFAKIERLEVRVNTLERENAKQRGQWEQSQSDMTRRFDEIKDSLDSLTGEVRNAVEAHRKEMKSDLEKVWSVVNRREPK